MAFVKLSSIFNDVVCIVKHAFKVQIMRHYLWHVHDGYEVSIILCVSLESVYALVSKIAHLNQRWSLIINLHIDN